MSSLERLGEAGWLQDVEVKNRYSTRRVKTGAENGEILAFIHEICVAAAQNPESRPLRGARPGIQNPESPQGVKSVRRDHTQGSLRGPRIRAAATLDTGLRSASGVGGREGRSQARAIGTNRSQKNRTNSGPSRTHCAGAAGAEACGLPDRAPTSRYAAVITPQPSLDVAPPSYEVLR